MVRRNSTTIDNFEDLKKALKDKLIALPVLRGLKEERAHLFNVLKRSICYGESDSLIVVGPKGSGKTLLVKTCLNDLEQDDECASVYSVVYLNALVHTDDNLALKDIIQQLHCDKLEGDRILGSFADNLLFVLQSLKSGDRMSSKPIIFILDEFQLFCSHRNQTLLYNLFDVAQSAQAPICVIGVTSRVDITELLEKRVKSRFSHRQICISHDSERQHWLQTWKSTLQLNTKSKTNDLSSHWNSSVEDWLEDEQIVSLLDRQRELSPSEKSMKNLILYLICNLKSEHDLKKSQITALLNRRIDTDVKVSILKDLSVLEFCLIIAMKHHVDIYDGEPFNFVMVLKQYMKFAKQNMGHQVVHRPIIFKAFERIKDLELMQAVGGSSKSYQKEYQLYTFNLLPSQVNEAVNVYPGLPTDVQHWANSHAVQD